MHEYGHTIDSKKFGIAYLFIIGIPSLITASKSKIIEINNQYYSSHNIKLHERRANINSKKYFVKNYNLDWTSVEAEFPTKNIKYNSNNDTHNIA